MNHEIVYIGCYTPEQEAGINVAEFNNQTGQLTLIKQVSELSNSSFLALSKDKKNLFAVSENDPDGELGCFDISNPSAPVYINKQSTLGGSPCHISVGNDNIYVSNYGAGSVSVFALNEEQLTPVQSQVQHVGHGADVARQEAAHAHASQLSRDERFLVVADLGIDAIKVYCTAQQRLTLLSTTQLPAGAGPRHLTFNHEGDKLYLGNELNNSVAVFAFNQQSGALRLLQQISSLPKQCTQESYLAELVLSKDGHYLYVSNRGHDSIAVFSVARQTGLLSAIDNSKTEGLFPRHFALSQNQDWLLVAHQHSEYVHIFKRDKHSGLLSATTQKLALKNAVCICFL